MTLELTTKLRHISTSPAARAGGLSPSDAVSRAMASLRYITRDDARPDVIAVHEGKRVGSKATELADLRKQLAPIIRTEAEARAERGGRRGSLVASTLTVSLPSSWSEQVQRQATVDLAGLYLRRGCRAVVASRHRDNPKNPHIHLLIIDGPESRIAARKRATETGGRIRRGDALRLNAGGSPKRERAAVAEVLNDLAEHTNSERVEWRSFKTRGIERTPGKHRGAAANAKAKAEAEETARTPEPAPLPQHEPAPLKKVKRIQKGGKWITIEIPADEPHRKRKRDAPER